MGRRFKQDDEEETRVDISPLIDCVFILLIFFIVTTTFVDERGVGLEKSQPGGNSSASDNEPVVLMLPGGNQVLFQGRDIGLGGIRAIVRSRLRDDETPVTIQAGSEVPVSFLTRVRDEVNLAGAPLVQYAVYKGGR
jgi:biopolymer transport protein ExbD